MLFNDPSDIEYDIYRKIKSYLFTYDVDNNGVELTVVKHLISLLSVYLNEIKILSEISQYSVDYEDNVIVVKINMFGNDSIFNIDLISIIRKSKINNIQEKHNNK